MVKDVPSSIVECLDILSQELRLSALDFEFCNRAEPCLGALGAVSHSECFSRFQPVSYSETSNPE